MPCRGTGRWTHAPLAQNREIQEHRDGFCRYSCPKRSVYKEEEQLPMRLTARCLLPVISYLIIMTWPLPADAQSTADGCSCDLVSRYNPQSNDHDRRDGANVVGATSCFLSTHRRREWCSFDIVTQRADSASQRRHAEVVGGLLEAVGANEIRPIVEELQSEFRRASELRFSAVRDRAVLSQLLESLDANQAVLFSCARTFAPGGEGRSAHLSTTTAADFGCGVHPEGWLTLFFGVVGRPDVFYLLAPLDG